MEAILEPLMTALCELIIGPLLALLGHLLLGLLLYIVGMPFFCLFCTPVVLICACFGPGEYFKKVMAGYKGVLASGDDCMMNSPPKPCRTWFHMG